MSVRTFKKLSKKLLYNSKPLIFLCIFAYIIMQPHRFYVDIQQENGDLVRAEYEELLNQASDPTDASIQFETLIVWENWEATITYLVAAWDSLWSIAKNFWTTTKAIIDANNIENANKLKPWQKLIITYNDGVFVNIKTPISIKDFSDRYELDKEEFLSMNYFDDEELTLEEWRQVVVPLNQLEAEKRGLIEKKEFVMLDLPEKEKIIEPILVEKNPTITDDTDNNINEDLNEESYQQIVISVEETESHLENLKKEEEEALRRVEEAKIKAEEARIRAEEARIQAEKNRSAAAQKAAEEARIQAEQTRIAVEKEAQKAKEQKEKALAAQKALPVNCWDNQCAYKWKCWVIPENGYCAETDNNNAWLCNEWFVEYNGSCVDKNNVPAKTPLVPTSTSAQWYFNPHKVDPNVLGWGPWHCTAMAAYMWSQNFGIRIRDYWTWNAKDWLDWARNAWFVVNMTPAVWALMVSWNWYWSRWAYWHVMYVESVDLANGVVTVVDMNYKWTYIATRRTEAISAARWFIHPIRN